MTKRKYSKEEFEEFLKVLIDQKYPEVKYLDPDSCIADYLKKKRHSRNVG